MVLAAFLIALVFMILAVVRWKIHPFLALLLGGILMGLLSGMSPVDTMDNIGTGFGNTMADIGILIFLGVMLGELLHNSGATRNIAGVLLKKLGVENTPLAICITGFNRLVAEAEDLHKDGFICW
jgi:GntP family gluconate:H+ symporter